MVGGKASGFAGKLAGASVDDKPRHYADFGWSQSYSDRMQTKARISATLGSISVFVIFIQTLDLPGC
jgi:hypothetical protein